MSKPKLEIRQIKASDRLTGLSLGDSAFTPLKIFLQKHAKAYHERNLARTYAAFDAAQGGKVAGYITLVSGEIVLEGDRSLLDEPDIQYNYKSYPALKIARLAVHEKYRDVKLGTYLVQLALGTAKDIICPAIGCRFVAVDSKQQAVNFYLKQGFSLLDTRQNKQRREPVLFIDLHKAS
ncbi:GNAT family N-acetyltransferase [Bradyrhizobium sp. DASA03076]|uniref:GNAT family N-acetyltransferase n=1 Tax=Bradyrhizobium sp. BLXBL-03 TaxID=3395916 RepID=UPI003F6E9826